MGRITILEVWMSLIDSRVRGVFNLIRFILPNLVLRWWMFLFTVGVLP